MSAGSIRAGKAHVEMNMQGQNQVLKSMTLLKTGLKNAAASIAVAGAAAVVTAGAMATAAGIKIFKDSIKAASDFSETLNKLSVVFKDQTEQTKEWGATYASVVGRSRRLTYDMLAAYQSLLVPMGIDPIMASGISKSLTKLAYDIASLNNKTDEQAMLALLSALKGSYEPMQAFNSVLSEARVNMELFNAGIKPSAATAGQKAIARYNLILRDTKDAYGDAINTADGYANSMKGLNAQWEEFLITIGTKFLGPAASTITWLGEFTAAMGIAAETAGEMDGSIGELGNGFEAFTKVLKVLERSLILTGALWDLQIAAYRAAVFPLSQVVRLLALGAKITGIDETGAYMDAIDQFNKEMVDKAKSGLEGLETFASDADTKYMEAFEKKLDERQKKMEEARQKVLAEAAQGPQELDPKLGGESSADKDLAEKAAKKAIEDLKSRGKAITSSVLTPMERYKQSQRELIELVNKGTISWNTYSRASVKAVRDLAAETTKFDGSPMEVFHKTVAQFKKELESGNISWDAFKVGYDDAFKELHKGLNEQASELKDTLETPQQEFKKRMQELGDLRRFGKITEDELNRGRTMAWDDLKQGLESQRNNIKETTDAPHLEAVEYGTDAFRKFAEITSKQNDPVVGILERIQRELTREKITIAKIGTSK